MSYRVPRCSRRFAARLFAAWRRALAALPRWARAQGLRGVVLAAACAPGGGWLWGGAANAAEYANVYIVENPNAQNGGHAPDSLAVGDLLRINESVEYSVNNKGAIQIDNTAGVTVAVSSSVTVSGKRALQLTVDTVHPNCSINIAGGLTATTDYALMDSKKNGTNSDHSVFNFLNGATVSATQNSTTGIQTKNASFMTFGYASGENGDTLGDAVGIAKGTGSDTGALSKVDNSAVINISVPITKADSGAWTAYIAAGTTNFYFNQTTGNPQSNIASIHVGAAGFTETDLIPKTDNAYTATKIVPVAGAQATANFGKEGDTSAAHYRATFTTMTINSGGTVNVAHSATVSPSLVTINSGGSLNLTSGGVLTASSCVIDSGGMVNVTHSANVSASSAIINSGGSLNLASGGKMTLTSAMTLDGGTLSLGSGTTMTANSAAINVNSGGKVEVISGGSMVASAVVINSGGMVNVANNANVSASSTTINSGGTLTLISSGTMSAPSGMTLNGGTISHTSGTINQNTIISAATGKSTITGDGTVAPKAVLVAEDATLNLSDKTVLRIINVGQTTISGTLTLNDTASVTFSNTDKYLKLKGTVVNNRATDLRLQYQYWQFVNNTSAAIGAGSGWVNFGDSLKNTSRAIDLTVAGKAKSGLWQENSSGVYVDKTADFCFAANKTYTLQGTHVHTCGTNTNGTAKIDGTLTFDGATASDAVMTLNNKEGRNNVSCYITTVTVAADKYGTLNGNVSGFNDAKNLQTVTINDGGTLFYGMTNVTAPKMTTLNLHGTLTNQRAAGATALAVTKLNVAEGESGILNGTGKITVTSANLTGGELTNAGPALAVTTMTAQGSSFVKGAGEVNATALAVGEGTLTFDNPGTITAANVSSGGALVLKDGTLTAATVAGTLDYQKTGATDLTLAGGTAKVAAGETLTAAAVSGFGALSGPGEAAVTTLTATGGTLTKSAPGAVASAVADGGTLALQGGTIGTAAVRNGGALNYQLAADALTLTELDGALNNARGAELTVSGLAAVDGTASVTGGPVRFADAITVTGTLNLDAKTQFANGLTVNGGTLGVKFDTAAAPAATVTGTADFSGGGKVKVAARGGAGGSAYPVITAGSFVGLDLANASVTGDTAILRYSLRLDPGALMLLCERKSYTEYATNPSDWGLAAALDAIAAQPGLAARMDDVFSTLDALGSPGAVSRALAELNYGAAAGVSTATARMAWRNFDDLLSARISREAVLLAARRAMLPRLAAEAPGDTRAQAGGQPTGAPGDVASGLEAMWRPGREWRGFLQLDGGFGAEASGAQGAVGYDYRGLGLLAGLERRYGEELALGALLGWTTNHGDLYQSRGEAHDNVLRLGGYGAWRWGGFFASCAPTVGCHLLETRRHIGFMGRTARGERTGLDVHLLGQAGYVWELPRDFLVTPEASFGLTYLHDPAYTETSAGGACLKVDALDDWALTQNLKLTLGKAVRLGGGLALLPEVWGGWEHEYGATNDVSCAFAAVPGMKWRVPVADIAADRAVVGAGVHALFNDRVDLYGRYELKLWEGGSFSQFTLGAGIKF